MGCAPTLLSASSTRPSSVLRTVTKMNFTSRLSSRNVLQPWCASSAWLFGHHGAQKWTTVTCGPRTAAATSSSTFSQPAFACANAPSTGSTSRPSPRKRFMRIR